MLGVSKRTAPRQGGALGGEFASRPMVARLVRYGPVRQKATFLKDAVAS